VADALFDAARALEDPDATALCVDPPLRAAAERARARYADPAWTWRR
jgi:hypothetical protein